MLNKQKQKQNQNPNLRLNTENWKLWLDIGLLWIGGLSLGLSIIFLIAYNWAHFDRFAKFAGVQALLGLVLFIYYKKQHQPRVAQAALSVNCLLLGGLLALYGQTYQTGADPWQLFCVWAILITPWVWVAKFSPLFLFWLLLANLSLILYFDSLSGWRFSSSLNLMQGELKLNLMAAALILNTLALLVWQFFARSAATTLLTRWSIRLLAIICACYFHALLFNVLFNSYEQGRYITISYLLFGVVWLNIMFYSQQKIFLDLFILTLCCFSLSLFVLFIISRTLSFGGLNSLLLCGGFLIISASLSVKWLKKAQQEFDAKFNLENSSRFGGKIIKEADHEGK